MAFSTYEQTRIAEARSAVNQYTRRIRQSIDRLNNEIHEKTLLRDEDYGSQKRSLNDDLAATLKRQSTLSGLESQEYAELSKDQEEQIQIRRKMVHRLGRNPKLSMHEPIFTHWLLSFVSQPYVAFLTLLALLETPINSFAVELAIGFLPPISWIVAFLIGVVFVLIAHFRGIHMRRLTTGSWVEGFWRGLVLILAFLLGVFMIYVLFAMRGEVTSLITPQGFSNLNILDQPPAAVAPSGPDVGVSILSVFEEPLRKYFNISGAGILSDETKFAQLGLLMLNTSVLIIGTALSFVRHDPNEEIEAAALSMLAATRKLNRFLRAFRQVQAKTYEHFTRRITELQREADQLNNEVEALESKRDQYFAQMDNDVGQIFSVLAEQISAYQDGNRNKRTADVPAYFGKTGMRQLGPEILAE